MQICRRLAVVAVTSLVAAAAIIVPTTTIDRANSVVSAYHKVPANFN